LVGKIGTRRRKFRQSNFTNEDPGKVFFLTMCPVGSFLHMEIREEFKEYKDDIEVLQVNNLGKSKSNNISLC